MPTFNYVALDAKGEEQMGALDAGNEAEAIGQLRRTGLYPTQVVEKGKGAVKSAGGKKAKKAPKAKAKAKSKGAKGQALFGGNKVKGKVLMIFTRQLATLIDSGLPLLRGLTVLAKQEPNPVLKRTINSLADSVQTGSTFSESLAQHPKIFNKLYVNMVKAGELGGVLELVLVRLAEYQEKAQKLKNKIVAAMVYPVIVMIIATGIMIFLLTFIVPKFKEIFEQMLNGKALPGLTTFVINVSEGLQENLLWLGLGVVLAIVGFKVMSGTAGGRGIIDRVKLAIPMFGDIQRKSAVSRFSRTLGTLVTSGVPILQALNITKETAGNLIISNAIASVHDAVKEGESIVAPLEASKVFPPMVISMVDVGEETGQLPEMLLKVADVYDDEVDNSVAALTAMLEPLTIVVLAVVVGTIVMALFLPLVSIITEMSSG
jgi:type IV pilus assembly protein PilC